MDYDKLIDLMDKADDAMMDVIKEIDNAPAVCGALSEASNKAWVIYGKMMDLKTEIYAAQEDDNEEGG